MSRALTRFVRFLGKDGKVYCGDASAVSDVTTMKEAEVLTGNIFDGSATKAGLQKIDRILAPVFPTEILCIGLNYQKHYEESAKGRGIPVPDCPAIFMKAVNSISHPGSDIWIPELEFGDHIDYEVELAMVVGRHCSNVSPREAMDYIFGFTVANDVSNRYWQNNAGAGQWIKGKSFDTFCPMGPVLVRREEIDHKSVRVRTRVNGETKQDSTTADMIFPCEEIVSWLSRDTTLLPGTVILTGTPEGVGAGKTPPVWLQHGDEVECEVDGIGTLRNRVIKTPNPRPTPLIC